MHAFADSVAEHSDAVAAIAAHRMTQIVDQVFAMDDAANAIEYLATDQRHFAMIAFTC